MGLFSRFCVRAPRCSESAPAHRALVALQAQDIIREIIGLSGRDDEIGHPVMARLHEHFQRQRRGRCPVGDLDEIWPTTPRARGRGLDRMTILAPSLGETM